MSVSTASDTMSFSLSDRDLLRLDRARAAARKALRGAPRREITKAENRAEQAALDEIARQRFDARDGLPPMSPRRARLIRDAEAAGYVASRIGHAVRLLKPRRGGGSKGLVLLPCGGYVMTLDRKGKADLPEHEIIKSFDGMRAKLGLPIPAKRRRRRKAVAP